MSGRISNSGEFGSKLDAGASVRNELAKFRLMRSHDRIMRNLGYSKADSQDDVNLQIMRLSHSHGTCLKAVKFEPTP
jgi:hypothetical protein